MKKNNHFRAFRKRVALLLQSRMSEISSSYEHYVNHLHYNFAIYCKKMLFVTLCHVVFNVILVLLHFICY